MPFESINPFCRNISASLRQAGQSIAADASTTNVLRRELVGEYYEILAIPSGAGDQQAVEPEEMGGVTNRLSALAVEFAITTPSHAERLDRRRVCELQGTPGA